MNWVYFFCGFGLICIIGVWPLLHDVGFLVAGIMMIVLGVTYWLKVVRKVRSHRVDESRVD